MKDLIDGDVCGGECVDLVGGSAAYVMLMSMIVGGECRG
jgi:hypothetical protein